MALATATDTIGYAEKFSDPHRTASGEKRAVVHLTGVRTLWFNTGTLCNVACQHCYIKSSPTNDSLVYLNRDEVAEYLRQIEVRNWPTREIGFTGGEPFMNPHIIGMLEDSLAGGYDVLVLTNAMRPMMRPRVQQGLLELHRQYASQLTLRVSMDHYTAKLHDEERGAGSFEITLNGMRWLAEHGIRTHVAGRTMWGEDESSTREGFARLFAEHGFQIDAFDPAACVLFPEMDEHAEVPEITEGCWDILGKKPEDIMCATSRMVVKRKGAEQPAVLSCTLLTESPEFELGPELKDAECSIQLNHPHCAKFCVLGGASCSS